jgi:hypothetical protein
VWLAGSGGAGQKQGIETHDLTPLAGLRSAIARGDFMDHGGEITKWGRSVLLASIVTATSSTLPKIIAIFG